MELIFLKSIHNKCTKAKKLFRNELKLRQIRHLISITSQSFHVKNKLVRLFGQKTMIQNIGTCKPYLTTPMKY